MKEYPEDIIITFDDDIIYENFIIKTLYDSYLEHPNCVSTMRVDSIKFLPDGSLANYMDFDFEYRAPKGIESYRWIASSGSGTLFPPGLNHEELFNISHIKKYCPTYDEVWLKFMQVLSCTKVVPAWDKMVIPGKIIFGSQKFALYKMHFGTGENIRQLKSMLDAYSNWRDPKGRTLLEVIRED